MRTSSQISGRPWPPADAWCAAGAGRDGAVVAVVVAVADVAVVDVAVVDVAVVGVAAVVVGAGAVVVVGAGAVAVGVSGKRSVRVGGTCPGRVAPLAGDVETLAATSSTQTAPPIAERIDGNALQSAVVHCHTLQKIPPGDANIGTHWRKT